MNELRHSPLPKHALRTRPVHIPIWVLLTLLIVPVAGTVWFGFVDTAPLGIDQFWHDSVVAHRPGFSFSLAYALHVVGSTKFMAAIGAVITLFFVVMQRWREAIAVASTLIGVLVVTKIIKFFVDRPRPMDMLVEQDETSFPSGHSLGGAAIMTILVCIIVVNNQSHRVVHVAAVSLGSVYVLTMMWSRTALHVHWLSDVVSGSVLGVTVALLSARLVLRLQVENEHEIQTR